MIILHNIDDDIFGKNLSKEDLINKIRSHWHTLGVEASSIEFLDDRTIKVIVNCDAIEHSYIQKVNKATELCNDGNFKKAESLLGKVTKDIPLYSEAWRLLAQIHFQEQNFDLCENELISALSADPKNKWALILMGNLYSTCKNDFESAEKYYLTALKFYPDDMISYNNLAGLYMKEGMFEQAIPIFEKVLKKEPSYLNAYYGLASCYFDMHNYNRAWEYCHRGLLNGVSRNENPGVREELSKKIIEISQFIEKDFDGKLIWEAIIEELHEVDGIDILIEEDRNTWVNAHISYANGNGHGKHILKYNPTKPHIDHLFVHELTHLRMMQLAQKANKNKFVISTVENEQKFAKRYGLFFDKALKNLPFDKAKGLREHVFHGLGLQLLNCPLDMFVEEYIYKNYPVLRPIQFLSLLEQENINIKGANSLEISKYFPRDITTANKVMNLCSSIFFKNLFGIDTLSTYKPSKQELIQAEDLYEEYRAYSNYTPGEEYELCEYFAASFNFENLISIVPEEEIIRQRKAKAAMTPTEKEEEQEIHSEESSNATFAESHKDGADLVQTTMMQMYMLGAMQYLDKVDKSMQKMIAQEIMITGTKGINPNGRYSIPAIHDKEFGGWEFLAYYYVSVAWAFPEILDKLGLPFKTAYNGAWALFKNEDIH